MAGSISNTVENDIVLIGSQANFWLYSRKTGFDLTHPPSPSSSIASSVVKINTTTQPITIDPAKSALVTIDMQNFFLHPALGRKRGAGHTALDNLVENSIPACRKAGIQIVWLNWGLTEKEAEEMPPTILKDFGFESLQKGDNLVDADVLQEEKKKNIYKGLGHEMGNFTDPKTGEAIDAGKMLIRDSWNAALYPPLAALYAEGSQLTPPDVWIHKNRMSGLWGSSTACSDFLESKGIKTLLFSGVNTDQCVSGTLTDAFSKGYDCILLSDGCGTTSPDFAQQGIEFNAANTWGFMATCRDFAEGVAGM